MSPQLSTALCSITPTQRRRYFWAVWWTGEPSHEPFRRPDASNGGARSFEEAMVEAQCVAGRSLTIIDAHWARSWKSVLRGGMAAAPPPPREPAVKPEPRREISAWAVLGLSPGASIGEVKRAFQRRALETHPDQGGEAEHFRQVQRAYEKLCERLEQAATLPRRKR